MIGALSLSIRNTISPIRLQGGGGQQYTGKGQEGSACVIRSVGAGRGARVGLLCF